MASFTSSDPASRRAGRLQRAAPRPVGRLRPALLALLSAWAMGQARAESRFAHAPPGMRQGLTATAHLDFRITIVPMLTVDSRQPPAVLVASGGGEAAIRPGRASRRGSTPQIHQLEPVSDNGAMRWTCTEP